MHKHDHTRTVDGRELTITVDTSDYPEFIIEGATDEEGNEVELSKEQELELYVQLGSDIASDMASEAEFRADLAEDR